MHNSSQLSPSFTALDFETAQGYRWSICQVGVVRVECGEVVATVSQLIQPPDNAYWWQFSQIHGITSDHTEDAPTFGEYWDALRPFIEGQTVVAHNASFDVACLRQALDYYQIAQPAFESKCTYRLYGKGLARACEEYCIPLNHHDALSDARACAELYLREVLQ